MDAARVTSHIEGAKLGWCVRNDADATSERRLAALAEGRCKGASASAEASDVKWCCDHTVARAWELSSRAETALCGWFVWGWRGCCVRETRDSSGQGRGVPPHADSAGRRK